MNLLINWLDQHSSLVFLAALLSVCFLLLTVIATPRLIARLPSDYLINPRRPKSGNQLIATLTITIRTFFGAMFALLGVVMMFTPGPGIVMLLLGLSIAEFPGKQKLLHALATRPQVFASLNWMRKRHNRPPFDLPPTTLD